MSTNPNLTFEGLLRLNSITKSFSFNIKVFDYISLKINVVKQREFGQISSSRCNWCKQSIYFNVNIMVLIDNQIHETSNKTSNNNNDNNNDNNNNNTNNNNNNNNLPETRKYWVDVQRGIVSSHGERDPL